MVQQSGQPRPSAAGQRQRDGGQRPGQRRGPPGTVLSQPRDLFGERLLRAARRVAEEPAHAQPDHHAPAAGRRIGQPPLVSAVHPPGGLPAPRAHPLDSPDPRPDHEPAGCQLGFLDHDPGQMRQQLFEADPMLA